MLNNLPKKVRIVEVGPRDGLQNEKTLVSLQDKRNFILDLVDSGIKEIEATSFVRADKIPQMQDSKELFKELINHPKLKNTKLITLVPNMKGMEEAHSLGVKDIAVFTSVSDTFNKKNINSTVDESLLKIEEVMAFANKNKIKSRGYVSCSFGCPYEGNISIDKLIDVANKLLDFGVEEISIGDTIGISNPLLTKITLEKVLKKIPASKIAMHFHDTRGLAIANILASLEFGITIFDSSAGGLGGCPYAKGATGNIATEDLVYLFNSLNIESGIDLNRLSKSSEKILKVLNKQTPSKVLTTILNQK